MDEITLRKIYTYSVFYITIAIILLAIPLFIELWANRPIRD